MVDSPLPAHVYLARHGRTPLNAQARLRGLADPPLDAVGVAEAHRLARVLVEVRPGLVLSGPLERAVHTARIIAETAGVSSAVDDGFNDRDYGPWTGQRTADVAAAWGSIDAAPGVEPRAAVLTRAFEALEAAADEVRGSAGGTAPAPIVVVTHDAVIHVLLESIDESLSSAELPTASWTHLVRTDGRWTAIQVGQLSASDLSPTPPPSARRLAR